MRVYIQSKSGNFNVVEEVSGVGTLRGALDHFRYVGGYKAEHRDKEVFVPFEQIEFIRKAGTND